MGNTETKATQGSATPAAKQNKAPNYSKEQVERMLAMYDAGEPVERIGEAIGKTKRSVISKLVREGVYVAPEKPVRQPVDTGPTKKEMLRELESLNFNTEGFEGATKSAIARLIQLAAIQTPVADE